MINRVFKLGILASAIQVMLYWLLLIVCKYSGVFLFDKNPGYIPKYSIGLSVIFFAVLVVFQNITTAVINKKTVTWVSVAVAATFYFFNWGVNFRIWPVQTIIFLAVGIVVLLSKFVLDKLLMNNTPEKQ